MHLFVIPVATSANPSILFKISELAVDFTIMQILALLLSLGSDLEGYAIVQSPPLRRLVLSWKDCTIRQPAQGRYNTCYYFNSHRSLLS